MLETMVAGIAHGIWNPLSVINIHLANLEKLCESMGEPGLSAGKPAARKCLEEMQAASNKIRDVVKSILDLSEPHASHCILADMNQVVRDVVQILSEEIRGRDIVLEMVLDDRLPHHEADPYSISQVLMNLIINAMEALDRHKGEKRICVETSLEDGNIVIGVSDSGPGISPMIREKIFAPFFTTKHANSGIGLSVGARIVKSHGGALEISSSRLGGAAFKIILPGKREV